MRRQALVGRGYVYDKMWQAISTKRTSRQRWPSWVCINAGHWLAMRPTGWVDALALIDIVRPVGRRRSIGPALRSGTRHVGRQHHPAQGKDRQRTDPARIASRRAKGHPPPVLWIGPVSGVWCRQGGRCAGPMSHERQAVSEMRLSGSDIQTKCTGGLQSRSPFQHGRDGISP